MISALILFVLVLGALLIAGFAIADALQGRADDVASEQWRRAWAGIGAVTFFGNEVPESYATPLPGDLWSPNGRELLVRLDGHWDATDVRAWTPS